MAKKPVQSAKTAKPAPKPKDKKTSSKKVSSAVSETSVSRTAASTKSANDVARSGLPQRFYKIVAVLPVENGYGIFLDKTLARTPKARPLILPTLGVAGLLAQEWQNQGATINPLTMPMTRIASVALDAQDFDPQTVINELLRYAGTDMVCYRASEPEGLVELQDRHWGPVLKWAAKRLQSGFIALEGVRYIEQTDTAMQGVRLALEVYDDALSLACLHLMTTISGSALIALMCAMGDLTIPDALRAAHIDEDWNISKWGRDEEAQARRNMQDRDFGAAARLFSVLRQQM